MCAIFPSTRGARAHAAGPLQQRFTHLCVYQYGAVSPVRAHRQDEVCARCSRVWRGGRKNMGKPPF